MNSEREVKLVMFAQNAMPKKATTPASAPREDAAERLLAPLDLVALAAEAVAAPEDEAWEVPPVVVVAAPVEVGLAEEVGPPMGAVDCPSIWAWTEALNVPVMLAKLL